MNRHERETTDYLLALAERHHFSLTADQLHRLHLEDMIERPIQAHPLGKVGSETVYPTGTGDLLLAICTLRQQKRQSFTTIAWQLWWDGYPIPLARIRADLRKEAEQWEKMRSVISRPGAKKLSRLARKFLEKFTFQRIKYPELSQARKRIGCTSFATFTRIVLEIGAGSFQGYEDDGAGSRDEEQKIMEKGFGLSQTPIDRAHNINWTTNLEQGLIELSNLVASNPWYAWLDEVSDAELLRNRDDFRLLLTALESLSSAIEEAAGKGAVGGLVLYQTLYRVVKKALPFSFLSLSLLRQQLPTAMDEILGSAHQWLKGGKPAFVVLQQLQVEVPAIRLLLAPQRWKATMRSERAQKRHLLECQLFYEQHREELMAFWERHPEWYKAITDQQESAS